jgi:hypothetical protein
MVGIVWLDCGRAGVVDELHIVVLQISLEECIWEEKKSKFGVAEDISCSSAVSKFECGCSVQS